MDVSKYLIALVLAMLLIVSLFGLATYASDEGDTAIKNFTGRLDDDDDEADFTSLETEPPEPLGQGEVAA